tara:strand:+ start:46 stop:522 length:477 start_codon:yes stop_codon:yes gene_type:complete
MTNIVEPTIDSVDVYADVSMDAPVDTQVDDIIDEIEELDEEEADAEEAEEAEEVDDHEHDEHGNDIDPDDLVVKKGTVRYKFVIILFLLSITFFHPESLKFTKSLFSKINVSLLPIIHSSLFAIIIYLMLKYSDDSFIFSPCNVELTDDDYEHYINQE